MDARTRTRPSPPASAVRMLRARIRRRRGDLLNFSAATIESSPRWAVLIPLASLSLLSAGYFLSREWVNVFGDAAWYARATPAILGNQPLYPKAWLEPHVAAWPMGFNLPPADALVGPIASLSTTLWGVLMGTSLLLGLCLLWPRLADPWDFILVCGLIAFWPFWSALVWANVNSLVFLLLAIAYRWPRHAGWAIGAAAAIKASPIVLLAVLIGRRDWRQLLIALTTGAGLTLLVVALTGPWTLTDFIRVQVNESHPPLDYGWSATNFLPLPGILLVAVALICVSLARGGAWSWAIAATLVVIPTLWVHYWIWALVPLLGWLRSAYGHSARPQERSIHEPPIPAPHESQPVVP